MSLGPRRRGRRPCRRRDRAGRAARTRPCGCCCSTAPTSRATSAAATASPPTCSTRSRPSARPTWSTAGRRCAHLELAHGDVARRRPDAARGARRAAPGARRPARRARGGGRGGAAHAPGRAGSSVRDDRVVLDGEVSARVVVGADGVHSVVRPHLLGKPASRGPSRSAATRRPRPRRPGPRSSATATARPAGVRLGLRPRRRAEQRRLRRAAPGRASRRWRRAARCSSSSSRSCCPATVPTGATGGPPPAAVGLALEAARRPRSCSSATPPDWSTR